MIKKSSSCSNKNLIQLMIAMTQFSSQNLLLKWKLTAFRWKIWLTLPMNTWVLKTKNNHSTKNKMKCNCKTLSSLNLILEIQTPIYTPKPKELTGIKCKKTLNPFSEMKLQTSTGIHLNWQICALNKPQSLSRKSATKNAKLTIAPTSKKTPLSKSLPTLKPKNKFKISKSSKPSNRN